MAIYSWRESIRQGGVLKVFQTESFTSPENSWQVGGCGANG
jgi:hypothetical protein